MNPMRSLRGKLLAACGAVLGVVVLILSITVYQFGNSQDLAYSDYDRGLNGVKTTGEILAGSHRVREHLLNMALSHSETEQLRQRELMRSEATALEELIATYRAGADSENLGEALDDFSAKWSKSTEASEAVGQLLLDGQSDEAHMALMGGASQRLTEAINMLLLVQDIEDNAAWERTAASRTAYRTTRTTVVIITAVALFFGLLLTGLLADRATRQIQALAAAASSISEKGIEQDLGDFEQWIDEEGRQPSSNDDEVARLRVAFGRMVAGLRRFVKTSGSVATAIDRRVAEVRQSVTSLQEGYVEQSAAVNETVATLEQIRQSADSASEYAREVLSEAQHTRVVSEDGTTAVRSVIEGMQHIQTRVQHISSSIGTLTERALRIAAVNEAVSGIASQSRLLAVNAAIEAAKAGEAGSGFAVVASEVRQLAERSKKATTEVHSLLGEIDHAAESAVTAATDGGSAVKGGLDLAGTTREAIEALDTTVAETSGSVERISATVDQLAVGVKQIREAMSGIESTVGRGRADARHIADAVDGLSSEVVSLMSLASKHSGSGDSAAMR